MLRNRKLTFYFALWLFHFKSIKLNATFSALAPKVENRRITKFYCGNIWSWFLRADSIFQSIVVLPLQKKMVQSGCQLLIHSGICLLFCCLTYSNNICFAYFFLERCHLLISVVCVVCLLLLMYFCFIPSSLDGK